MKPKRRVTRDPDRTKRKPAPPTLIPANVILKSVSGRSAVAARAEMRPDNVEEFLPTRETLQEAKRVLTGLGFQIDLVADTHISILGPRELYGKVFQVRLREKVSREAGPFQGKRDLGQRYFAADSEPRLPRELAGLLETIEFPGAVIYHVVSPVPPALSYDHMEVPHDVARDMDALKAHARGITGVGIKLAMVDSGFTTPFHPYFVGKGYNIQPVVSYPGDPNPGDDSYGHGTAMAACALAVAPGATFTMYKISDVLPNPSDTFSRAVLQKPHIITNSWGASFSTTLQTAVNKAIKDGIVVLFSCGNNGSIGWPGSEPKVISVGGVFVDKDDSLRASNKASSGLASGRQCPDLCGICGENPKGILIAMPTQAGSDGDSDLAGPGFPNFDETSPTDGWAVGSGTSAAAAMVAGAAALVMQNDPVMAGSPPTPGNQAKVKTALVDSCRDVTAGKSANNEPTGLGRDNATGAGLVQAYRAVRPTDLWIKDNPDSDIGWVPTHNRRPAWPPFAHWVSPDIKVFSAPLTNPDMDFDPTPAESPIFGQDNYVYVRIRNRGIGASLPANTRLYYADPATNLVFPSDWNDGQSGVPGQGSLTVNGVATNLQTFPSVLADGQNVLPLPFVWRPPNPSLATQTQILSNGRISGHFCLLVRIESADDPIILAGGGQGSVIGDNNIGMANQQVYSGPPGAPFHFSFIMRGSDHGRGDHDLLFDLRKLPRKSDVSVDVSGQLRGPVKLLNATRSGGGLHLVARQKPAGLRGLTLKPNSRTLVKVSVAMSARTPQGDYPISVLQASLGHPLGGMTLVARVT